MPIKRKTLRFNEPGTVKVRGAGQSGGQELTINIHSGSYQRRFC
jgi:hypothetical protein